MENFEKIFELIPKYPGSYISIIAYKNSKEVEILKEFCSLIKATLHVNTIGENFSYETKRFNKHAIQYDFVFLCDEIRDIEVAKKVYRILKNAGHLFLVCKKDSTYDANELLEKSNFVALNSIDLNQTHDIISAKKMHGWMKV